jgi:hypothetical protein
MLFFPILHSSSSFYAILFLLSICGTNALKNPYKNSGFSTHGRPAKSPTFCITFSDPLLFK